MRTIDLVKLKESLNVLLDHVIDSGISSIALEQQYYWQVDAKDRFDLKKKPADLVVGDLFDELDFVERVLLKKQSTVAYTLTELAPILEYVGEIASDKLAANGG